MYSILVIMASKSTPKRKTHTLETKYKAIIDVEKKKSKTLVAKELGIPLNTLSTWLSKADYYKDNFQMQKFGGSAKRLKKGQYEGVEDGLELWMRQARTIDIPLSGPILKEQAQTFAKALGQDQFKASNGWLDRFKVRKNL